MFGHTAPNFVEISQNWLFEFGSSLAEIGPNLALVGPHRPKVDRDRSDVDRRKPELAEIGRSRKERMPLTGGTSTWADAGPMLTNTGEHRSRFPKLAQLAFQDDFRAASPGGTNLADAGPE